MAIEEKSDGRTVQLKGVRMSFCESFKDKKKTANTDDAKEAHSGNLIIEAEGPYAKYAKENRDKCLAAIKEACKQEFKREDKWKDIQDDNPKRIAYRKGERFKNQETGVVYAGYEGNMIVAGKGPGAGQRRPKLLDRGKRRLKEQVKNPDDLKNGRFFEESAINDIFYNGSYCDAVVSFYGTKKGGDGVFVTIEAVRSYQEGERMGGGIEVEDEDFDDFEDEDDLDGGSSSSRRDDDDDIG